MEKFEGVIVDDWVEVGVPLAVDVGVPLAVDVGVPVVDELGVPVGVAAGQSQEPPRYLYGTPLKQ